MHIQASEYVNLFTMFTNHIARGGMRGVWGSGRAWYPGEGDSDTWVRR